MKIEHFTGTSHFFLLILYKFKNIGGGACALPGPPYSAVPVLHANTTVDWTATTVAQVNAELASWVFLTSGIQTYHTDNDNDINNDNDNDNDNDNNSDNDSDNDNDNG